MRHIVKWGNGGYHLELANSTPPTNSEDATSRWKSFGHKEKVTNYLTAEQYGLCAYSEIRSDLVGLGMHIEHIEPKSLNPSRTFDYSNFVLSALTSDDLSSLDVNEVFGGHAKLSQYDPSLFISCLQPECEYFFAYPSTGRVEAAMGLTSDKENKAHYMIQLLNLNCPFLINQRKKWIDELDSLIEEHLDNNYSLEHLAMVDLLPTSQKLSPFFTATRQRFAGIAEQVLRDNVPELL